MAQLALFPIPPAMSDADSSTGVLPRQYLRGLLGGQISSDRPVEDDQLQPASLDLRLGEAAWRVRSSFLPGRASTVESKLDALAMHRLDLTGGGAVLERGCVYIAPLLESFRLERDVAGATNAKSSAGRLDIFTRVIADYGAQFDRIPGGYRGPAYAEISPRTFSVRVRTGSRLAQIRLRRGSPVIAAATLREQSGLDEVPEGQQRIRGGAGVVTVDLRGAGAGGIVGYRAKPHAGVIDVDLDGALDPLEFWDPVPAPGSGGITLDPNDFHIFATRECVKVPPDYAAEMAAYDSLNGEFRVHYAGFFDPGFGWSPAADAGARAVLEVRSHEVPFRLEDGHVVGRMCYERLMERPDRLYGGAGLGSHYQGQALALARQFRGA